MTMSNQYCEVVGCRSQKRNKNLSFFCLPKDIEKRKKWVEFIGRPDLLNKNSRNHVICSLHFDEIYFKYKPYLVPEAIPTKLLPNQPSTSNGNTKDYSECSTQTEESFIRNTKSLSTQSTEENMNENENDFSTDTSRKRKLCK